MLNAKTLEALMCAQSWLSTLQEGADREEFGTIDNDDDGEDRELLSNTIAVAAGAPLLLGSWSCTCCWSSAAYCNRFCLLLSAELYLYLLLAA
ncbi:hypothetical protein Dimus_022527, partial [Dionaea muscipula]